jgi:hypothetical protein
MSIGKFYANPVTFFLLLDKTSYNTVLHAYGSLKVHKRENLLGSDFEYSIFS